MTDIATIQAAFHADMGELLQKTVNAVPGLNMTCIVVQSYWLKGNEPEFHTSVLTNAPRPPTSDGAATLLRFAMEDLDKPGGG